MTRPSVVGVLLSLAWFSSGPAWPAPTPASAVSAVQAGATGNLRVLFIGNSYTHMNDLPQLTARLAASARPPRALETHFVGEGGADLKRHWEAGRALEAIRKGKWDYVVLQGQSALSMDGFPRVYDPKMFHDYARLFDAEIKKAGARTVFFLTWARRDSPQDQAFLTHAYGSIAGELKALVAPVGIAWQNALKENPKLVLHWNDGSHPDVAGTYLAACVFYAVLYSSSPEGVSPGKLSAADAALLQRIAWQTAKDPQLALAAGKVPTVDTSIPAAKPAVAAAGAATPAALERGRSILAAAQEAAGGLERLRGLKDVSVTFAGKIILPGQEAPFDGRETLVFPSLQRSEIGGLASFFDGDNGWRTTPQGVRDVPDGVKKFLRAQIIRNTFNLLRAEGDFSVQFEKREKMGETEADVILITKDGESVRLFVKPDSGTLLKKAFRGMGTGGLADIEEVYSDHREVSGMQVPFRVEVHQNGGRFMEATVKEVKFNTGINPAELAKKPQ